MKELFIKYKSIISYLFFGALTTAVSVLSYALFYEILSVSNIASTVISWVLAVSFAFVTNKLFVFESKSWKNAPKEALDFFIGRVLTGVLEVALMYVFVDLLEFDGVLVKIFVNIIVIILNYIISKLFVFKKK